MKNVLVAGVEHRMGDNPHECLECWNGFPRYCVCRGMIHAQFVKENWEGELTLEFMCDNCGKDYQFPKPKKHRFKPHGRKKFSKK